MPITATSKINIKPGGFLASKRSLISALYDANFRKKHKPIDSSKYVDISYDLVGKPYKKLKGMQSTLANFARANNLKISFNRGFVDDKDRIVMSVDKEVIKLHSFQEPVSIFGSLQPPKPIFYADTVQVNRLIKYDQKNEPFERKVYRALEKALKISKRG